MALNFPLRKRGTKGDLRAWNYKYDLLNPPTPLFQRGRKNGNNLSNKPSRFDPTIRNF
jgi:hypothetical protein